MHLPFKLPTIFRVDEARRPLVAALVMFVASASVAGLLILQSEKQRLREQKVLAVE